MTSNALNKKYVIVLFVLAVCCVVYYAYLAGFFSPYYEVADADTIYTGQTILINSGIGQSYVDHTGFLYITVLSLWIKLLYFLGALKSITLSDLSVSDNFSNFISPLIFSARFFSLCLSLTAVFFFSSFVTFVAKEKKYLCAGIAALYFATSPGVLTHSFIVRAEMLGALTFCGAVFLVFKMQQKSRLLWLWTVIFSMCVCATMATKVQILPGIMLLPFLGICWGAHWDKEILNSSLSPFIDKKKSLLVKAVYTVSFLCIAFVMVYLSRGYFSYFSDGLSISSMLIFAFILVGALIYKILYIPSWKIFFIWLGWLCLGLLGSLCVYHFFSRGHYNYIHKTDPTIKAILNPYEHMKIFAGKEHLQSPVIGLLFGLKKALIREFDIFSFLYRDIVYVNFLSWLNWGTLFMGVMLFRKKRYKETLVGAGFFILALGIESVFHFRYLAAFYIIYFEVFFVIAFFYYFTHYLSEQREKEAKKFKVAVLSIVSLVALCHFFLEIQCLKKNRFLSLNIKQKVGHVFTETHYNPYLKEELLKRAKKENMEPKEFMAEDFKNSKYSH